VVDEHHTIASFFLFLFLPTHLLLLARLTLFYLQDFLLSVPCNSSFLIMHRKKLIGYLKSSNLDNFEGSH
jgi:hypothetical protein